MSSGCASAMSLALHPTTHRSGRRLTAHPVWKPQSPAYTCWICCLAGAREASQTPSAERQERVFAENSDSTVATYKQMRGFIAAYRMQACIQQIRGYRLRRSLAQIRCSSHKLRVETGRYTSEAGYERTCRLCKSATAMEMSSTSLLHCPQLGDLRNCLKPPVPDTRTDFDRPV